MSRYGYSEEVGEVVGDSLVPKLESITAPDGTERMGSLEPLERDLPQG